MVFGFSHWFFIDCWLARLLRSRILGTFVPPLVGLYYLALDIWGESYWLFNENQDFHIALFLSLAGGTLFALTFRSVGDWMTARAGDEYTGALEKLIIVISKIIDQKSKRFRQKLQELKPNSSPFNLITQPKEQIEFSIREAQHFFADLLSVERERFDITILRWDPYKQKWYYLAEANQGRKHTKPGRLMAEVSAAKRCVETGEEVFIADKRRAARCNGYYLSERDKRHSGIGSAYCSPVLVRTPDGEEKFIVSFVSYGVRICSRFDKKSEEAAKLLFREFVRRLEVELTLLSIKNWKKHCSERSKGGPR